MANEYPIRFTLTDDTNVIVKKVTNNKYDFELTLSNGNRKTFIWTINIEQFCDRTGSIDPLIAEAVNQFVIIMNA